MPPGQLRAATWRPVRVPGWHQGVRIKGARPRLILASPGDTQQRRRRVLWSPWGGWCHLLLARGAQGCRTPYDAQGSPTGEPAAAHISGAEATRQQLQAGCVNALGGVSAQPVSQVCVSTGNAST